MTLEIAFLDVGNADSIVILPPGSSAIIIDAPKPRRIQERLEDRERITIDCLYFTHDHRDHLPSLSVLKTFVAEWLKKGKLNFLCLPSGAADKARKLADSNKDARLRDALDRLSLWEEEKEFEVIRAERGPLPHRFGEVVIYVLHPRFLFSERHSATHPHKINETALVLRVEYGEFSMLLLADVEQAGLTKLLGLCSDDELQCQIVKIPHHGAWQTNESDIQSLLERANPEFAVLSVGSRNQHGHVVPELFQELLRLRDDEGKGLQNFVCTEVTRTCVYSAQERAAMGRQGLPASQPCAGDIVILAESSGEWEMLNRAEHVQHLESILHAACCGRADLKV